MWIRIGTPFKIFHIGEPLVHIRKHGSNMSKHAERMRSNMRKVIGKAWSSGVVSRWNVLFWLRVWSIFHFQNAWMRFDEQRPWGAAWDGAISLLLWPWFASPRELNEPIFFRVRGCGRFVITALAMLLAEEGAAQSQ